MQNVTIYFLAFDTLITFPSWNPTLMLDYTLLYVKVPVYPVYMKFHSSILN